MEPLSTTTLKDPAVAPDPPGLSNPFSSLRRALALMGIAIVALMSVAGVASAAEPAAQVPATVVQPLGAVEAPVVVPYTQLIGAADARNLNAAVVDTSSYWVAATDREGHVIAAQIPRPKAGQDFAQAAGTATTTPARTTPPGAFDLATSLRTDGVTVLQPAASVGSGSGLSPLMRYLMLPLGIALIAALAFGSIALFRRVSGKQGGSRGGMAGHGKIRKNAQVEPPPVRFTDVAGCDEAVEELSEVVVFLSEPERFAKVGARMPRGVILHGPPGTGKTLLAKAVAGESGVPFFALSGSDFVDTYVGVGASRVRDLFALARKSETGAIIFFDEIDAIGRARGAATPAPTPSARAPSTSSWSSSTASARAIASWSSPRPTDSTCSTPPCCDPAASTAGSRWACRPRPDASRSCACTPRACRSPRPSRSRPSPG